MVTAYTASEESQRRRGEVSTQTVDGLSPWIKRARQDGEPEVVLGLQELTCDRSPPDSTGFRAFIQAWTALGRTDN
jgi:hypothetical protein